MKNKKGLSLIVLVITIVSMLIIAGVVIFSIQEDNPMEDAKRVKILAEVSQFQVSLDNYHLTQKSKESDYDKNDLNATGINVMNYIDDFPKKYTDKIIIVDGKVKYVAGECNEPELYEGLEKVMYGKDGKLLEEKDKKFNLNGWFRYSQKKWANAKSKDGSLWVWIPRFAYKVNADTKSFDVLFLAGNTNMWYNKDNKKLSELPEGYEVHPAFKNGKINKFANGEWDKEICGFWVSKFEAAYPGKLKDEKGNLAVNKKSSCVYTTTTCNAEGNGTSIAARNILDKVYGTTKTNISYPVFAPNSISMAYISSADAFKLCMALNEEGNIYGFDEYSIDSHMVKDSEWGAVSYLAYSQYGVNGKTISKNSLEKVDDVALKYTITAGDDYINNVLQSTTANIYGVYDMTGGLTERTASCIVNKSFSTGIETKGMEYLKDVLVKENNKYVQKYNFSDISASDINQSANANFALNNAVHGNAIAETSTAGTGNTSWLNTRSLFPALTSPVMARGGNAVSPADSSVFAYEHTNGDAHIRSGFRAVLIEGAGITEEDTEGGLEL